MPLDLYSVANVKPTIKVLVYGHPGAGKTLFAATAQRHPDLRGVVFANAEGGLLTVRSEKGIRAVDIRRLEDIEELFIALQTKANGFEDVRTVVIDSGTELQQKNLEEIVQKANAKKSDRSLDDIYIEDYGSSTNYLKRMFRAFRDLEGINVVITALAKSAYPKGADRRTTDPTEVSPSFTASLCEAVMGYMDFVWYLYADDEGGRHLLTQERNNFRAKTRGMRFAPQLGVVVDDPDLAAIYDLLLRTESGDFSATTNEEEDEGEDEPQTEEDMIAAASAANR